jgi:imidazoleglycerol-phosphate dehydratase
VREASISRKTNETDIVLKLNLDGSGKCDAASGIGFFDHMLNSFARHGQFDIELRCRGDLHVDTHHTVEDIGIVLGKAIAEAVGDKKGIRRYGSSLLPMDESLVMTVIDLSGRPFFVWDAELKAERVGTLETETVKEFFAAIAYSAAMNLHIKEMYGENTHHVIEAMFKAFARALSEAVSSDPKITGILSTKGSL